MNFFVIILFLFEVAECSATNIGFCEAKAQCAARGLPIASTELYYNPGRIGNLASLGTSKLMACGS
jgi:hypothetical protein